MPIVTSAQTSETRPATTERPISTTSPKIGSTSASTDSGLRTIDRPMNIIRNPPRRRPHVKSVFASRASANISAASATPSLRRSTRLPVFAT